LDGQEYFLGRWPSKAAAAAAAQRARAYLGGHQTSGVRPDAPEDLRREAHALIKRETTSRFHGVSWVSRYKCWKAEVSVKRRGRSIGHFENEVDAAKAYDRVALHLLGKKARLNFPGQPTRSESLEAARAEVRARRKGRTSSKYIGVRWDKDRKERPWFAMFTLGRKGLAIGRYRTEREAALVHDRAALFYRPKRMQLNFPNLAKKLSPASVDDLANELLREKKKKTKSRFVGVSANAFSYTATISHENRSVYLGSFDVEEDAARAYDRAALRIRGTKTKLNFDPATGHEIVGRRVR
jgi:hypothetical protein